MTAPAVSLVRCCCGVTLLRASIGTSRGDSSVSGGDTASDNEIMAPAAMVTPLEASSYIACIT